MKREIKFRAIINGLGAIEDVTVSWPLAENKYQWYVHMESFQEQFPEIDIHDEDVLIEKYGLSFGDEVIVGEGPVMQFIGLKDKYGTEIYEADILHSITTLQGLRLLWEVIYYRSYFTLKSLYSGRMHPGQVPMDTWQRSEIVGNIYQNPELIEND